jgi:hypothetical protein
MAEDRVEWTGQPYALIADLTRTGAASVMDPIELQARATIAAALITAHAVGVPSLPNAAARASGKDPAALQLRELTDYVYRALFGGRT